MSKHRKDEEDDEARQEKILEQLKDYGRLPTPPPSFYHETDKIKRRKDRKSERNRLRDLARNHNEGFEETENDD